MSEWQPIETITAKEAAGGVLVCFSFGYVAYAWKGKSNTWYSDGDQIFNITPTHWMPLPLPPKEIYEQRPSPKGQPR
jgi:hypothetical protein